MFQLSLNPTPYTFYNTTATLIFSRSNCLGIWRGSPKTLGSWGLPPLDVGCWWSL